jgi:oligopeptide/dipeptide ABC transporter ATP-binding protein
MTIDGSSSATASAPGLRVDRLTVTVPAGDGRAEVVHEVSFTVGPGEALGLVGESGSGKSMTLRATMALLPRVASADAGTVALDGRPMPLTGRDARRRRRGQIALVFQDAAAALDPVKTIGSQIGEVARHVAGLRGTAVRSRTLELLELVGIREPARRAGSYPHQLSGGMRQRAMLAVALAGDPEVLLCDEPTTALDVTVQAQVLALIDELRVRLRLAVVFVSHDLAVIRQVCEQVVVMYAGRIVESGPTTTILDRPRHPYTRALLEAVVDLDADGRMPEPIAGSIPEPGRLPPGCPFAPRCPLASRECTRAEIPLIELPAHDCDGVSGRQVACLHHDLVPVP